MTQQRIIIWYRNDLRIHDHEPLHRILEANAIPIPVYCFDPRQFSQTSFGFAKTSVWRSRFLLESVANLRRSLRSLGSNLIIRIGHPEVCLLELITDLNITALYWHSEVTTEEQSVSSAVRQVLKSHSVKIQTFWGSTLHHLDDLPFPVQQTPELFTQFRKQIEKEDVIRPCLSTPITLPPLPDVKIGELPTLEMLGVEAVEIDPRATLTFQGGETAGMSRIQEYFWERDRLRCYKETRNGMLLADDSSKLSPWLALGCLSPRYVYEQVQQYERDRLQNDSTYWLIFELRWRDYFRFIAAKHRDRIFRRSGVLGLKFPWKQDWPRFEAWCQGNTGFPLVDASMRELATTGWMSNRGRQNVASFLTKNLGIDWRMGAEWFESLLIDYDVCSNWGNWNYSAGVGNDARGFRWFNITKQSKNYDLNGDYLRHWLPELAAIPAPQIHEPWKLTAADQKRFNVQLGVDYPNAIVDLFDSAHTHERLYNSHG